MASSSSSSNSSPPPPVNLGAMAMTTSSEALKKGGSPFDMLNVYVMDHLLSFLPVKDIKNCRLVNRTWNQACLKVIPKIAHVVRILINVKKISELINLISRSPHFPWTNFKLYAAWVKSDADKALLAKVFGLVAPFATGIWIDNLEERLFTNVLTYPALKHLSLNYGFLLFRKKYIKANFAKAIVENAPNLDLLDLRGLRITDHALDLLGTVNGRKITCLEMRSVIESNHLIKLSELGLQLKRLSLQFRSTDMRDAGISPESIKIMLEGQSPHLKELELSDTDEDPQTYRRYCGYTFLKVDFPRMDKLTKLNISAFNANYHQDVCLATLFPSLGKLEFGEFRRGREVIRSFLKEDTKPIETVQELKFNGEDLYGNEDCELIFDAAKQFPNLKKIQIPNKKILLDCVGLSMFNVKELWLLLSDNEDLNANLTGVPMEAYEKVMKLSESQLKVWLENWEPPHCFRRITKLGLIAEKRENGRRDVLQLTEIGCRFGLLKMESLETLELVGDCSQISTELLNELSSKFTVQIRDDLS